jgi:hypothetical protein
LLILINYRTQSENQYNNNNHNNEGHYSVNQRQSDLYQNGYGAEGGLTEEGKVE